MILTTQSKGYAVASIVTFQRLACAFAMVCTALLVAIPDAGADSLDDIKARGKLIVGVKPDYRPWGYIGPDGKLIGMEPDLAADLAQRLGVALELVPARSADRLDLLKAGRIDVLISTMSDTRDRRQVVTLLLPHYYSSGTNILAHKRFQFKKWDDLKGRKICGREGAFYNRGVSVRYRADVVVFRNNQEAKKALRDGRCAAWLSDDSTIVAELRDGDVWGEYEMPLPTEDLTPWSIGLPAQDRDSALANVIATTVGEWHRSGFLIKKEKEWAALESEFLSRMHEIWTRKKDGDWLCKMVDGKANLAECNSVVPPS